MLSHENYAKGISGYIDRTGMHGDHTVLSLLPLYHVFPLLGCMLAPLFCGATIVISRNYLPRAVLKIIDDYKINYLTMVPLIYKLLLRYYKKGDYNLSSLTCCITGGDYVAASFQKEIYDKLGITLLQGYGLTECLPVICNPPVHNKFGTLGTSGRDDIAIRIADEQGCSVETGAIGEICISSPTVMSGYFRMDIETRMALSDGWLNTGDYGYLDDDGYLNFSGRKKKVAKVGGNMVDLKEVQNVLLSHPLISDASVYAVEDDLWGHSIKAEVLCHGTDSLKESDILCYCKKRLTGYKIPKEVSIPVEVV